jgi:hypothetical protein
MRGKEFMVKVGIFILILTLAGLGWWYSSQYYEKVTVTTINYNLGIKTSSKDFTGTRAEVRAYLSNWAKEGASSLLITSLKLEVHGGETKEYKTAEEMNEAASSSSWPL